jgi:predicted RNase H-like HicB family nuclease
VGKPGLKKVHRYSVEFKLTAMKLSHMAGIEVQTVANALDIHPFMLSRWRKEVRAGVLKGRYDRGAGGQMRNEFTAVVERAGRWHIAYCPEIPGANGQGRTKAAALKGLGNAIALILQDRRKDGLRGVPASARRDKVVVG